MENKIEISNIYKSFSNDDKKLFSLFKKTEKTQILENISFSINKGEIVGLIGPNGSGKTTLLKILCGLLIPDKGKIKIKGSISPMLDIGIGFHPELNGSQNIDLFASLSGNGEISGIKKKQIIEFSGLSQNSLKKKYKHYSSGMKIRLGFATISYLRPEIVVLDEISSVGDINFQNKTRDKILELASNSNIMIIVSHDVDFIKKICSRAIAIVNGTVLCDSTPEKTAFEYLKYMKEHKNDKI